MMVKPPVNKVPRFYRGWAISYDPNNRPVTGTWRAEKCGVGVCNNSLEGVKALVDFKAESSIDR